MCALTSFQSALVQLRDPAAPAPLRQWAAATEEEEGAQAMAEPWEPMGEVTASRVFSCRALSWDPEKQDHMTGPD